MKLKLVYILYQLNNVFAKILCRTRLDIHSLTTIQLEELKWGFEMLYRDNTIYNLANKHWQIRKQVHGCSQFLPFHNIFLYDLETHLRRYNKNITLPYWNWTRYHDTPLNDPVIKLFGDDFRKRRNNCTITSFNWTFQDNSCLERTFNDKSGNHVSWYKIYNLTNVSNYTLMERYLEQIHAYMHVWVGGSMITHYSPRDPLFYLHHAFVDKIWIDWSNKFNNYTYSGANCNKSMAKKSDKIIGYNVNVSRIIDNEYCVNYINNTKSHQTRIGLYKNINAPTTLSTMLSTQVNLQTTNWLLVNGFTQYDVTDFINKLNSIQEHNRYNKTFGIYKFYEFYKFYKFILISWFIFI